MNDLSPQMLGTRPAGSRDPASLRPQPRRDGADGVRDGVHLREAPS
jgi:hypothetical protein